MRKLIEKTTNTEVICDNPKCDYLFGHCLEDQYLIMFVNQKCPKCGEIILTMEDWVSHQKFIRTVDFINRWFSWLTIFSSKKIHSNEEKFLVHVNKGIKIHKLNNSKK